MVSHELKCIFIHIPKCAGTSIESTLGHMDRYQGRNGQDHRSIRLVAPPELNVKSLVQRDRLLDIGRLLRHQYRQDMNPANKIMVSSQQFNEYFKFTFVRNPWARVYSMYKNVIRDEAHRAAFGVHGDIPFDTFVERHAGKGMLRPQTYWITDYNQQIPLDYIGRFERLQQDFNEICQSIGIPVKTLPHRNKGNSEDYRAFYSQHSRDLIKQIYRDEIKRFGYTF